MGGLNLTGERRERILLLWNTVGETLLAKVFCSNMGIQSIHVSAEEGSCLGGVYTVRSYRQEMSLRRNCDRQKL